MINISWEATENWSKSISSNILLEKCSHKKDPLLQKIWNSSNLYFLLSSLNLTKSEIFSREESIKEFLILIRRLKKSSLWTLNKKVKLKWLILLLKEHESVIFITTIFFNKIWDNIIQILTIFCSVELVKHLSYASEKLVPKRVKVKLQLFLISFAKISLSTKNFVHSWHLFTDWDLQIQ